MINIALITKDYPFLYILNTLGISDIRLHLVLPNSIDTKCSSGLWFYVAVTNITLSSDLLILLFSFSHKDALSINFGLRFNKVTGACILSIHLSAIKVILNNSYIVFNTNSTIKFDPKLVYKINPGCLLLLQDGPKLYTTSAPIKCVGTFLTQNLPLSPLFNSSGLISFKLGINTVVTLLADVLTISGQVNDKLLDWGPSVDSLSEFLFYWSDLLSEFGFKNPNLILTNGLLSINGITNSVLITGSSDINVDISSSDITDTITIKLEDA